jgi:hypothetical protein
MLRRNPAYLKNEERSSFNQKWSFKSAQESNSKLFESEGRVET